MRASRRGIALLLVVGVLGILAVLGAAFVTMAQLERRASLQRLNATKASLLARSGIEDALARLSAGQEPSYGGEDWALDGYDPYDQAQEVFGPGVLDLGTCPARHALRPSWFKRDGTGKPWRTGVEGRDRGHSGELRAGAQYVQKVVPAEGIFVNGGDLTSAGEHPGTYDGTLKRILGNLAEEVGLPRTAGEALVLNRPSGGWTSPDQLPLAMRPYLVLAAWVDKKVIRPNIDPAWAPVASGLVGVESASAWAEIKVGQRDTPIKPPFVDPMNFMGPTGGVGAAWSGKRAFNTFTNSYAPDFERDGAGRVVGRAPVSLNWARDKPPLLRALLRDLAGVRFDESVHSTEHSDSTIASRDEGMLGVFRTTALGLPDLDAVVAAIQGHTGFPTWATEFPDWDQTPGFDSWDEFSRFVDLKLTALTQPQRDLLKANFNPNTASNKFNPGETAYKSLDKSDLTRYSTEFSFRSPAHVLTAAGRWLGPGGSLLAERTLSVTLRLRQVRLTTQSEFCAGTLGDPDLAGDEGAFRLPGAPGFLEPSGGAGRTYGSRFAGSPQGLCLQTYPEPQWPGLLCPGPAAYDGSLQLATCDTDAATPGITFLAAYDDRYNATFAAGPAACRLDSRQGPAGQSLLGRNPAGAKAILNQVYPDGCYSETYRVPGYESRQNIGDGYQGILSMWVRPFCGIEPGALQVKPRYPMFWRLSLEAADPATTPFPVLLDNTQVFWVGTQRYTYGKTLWGVQIENRCADSDVNMEDGAAFGWKDINYPPGAVKVFQHAHRWHLLTAQWNVLADTMEGYSFFAMNGTANASPGNPVQYYTRDIGNGNYGVPDGGGSPPDALTRLTRDTYREDGSFGTPYFYLGRRGFDYFGGDASAEATLDELLCVTRTTDMNDGKTLATDRFAAGRYYKEDGALDPAADEYTSAPIALGPGARVLSVDWTLVLPREFRGSATLQDLWPSPNRIFYGTGEDALAGKTADAALRLLDAGGASLLPSQLTRSGTALNLVPPGGTLKLGIDIRPRLDDNTGDWHKLAAPILESPVLDDITLTYTGPEGARLGSWREGE